MWPTQLEFLFLFPCNELNQAHAARISLFVSVYQLSDSQAFRISDSQMLRIRDFQIPGISDLRNLGFLDSQNLGILDSGNHRF